jgi:3-oxoacyl-[acyl-carrier protein] reductase
MNQPINQPMNQQPQQQGRTVIVTGAATGIGYSICQGFLQTGANVVLNDVDEQAAARAVQLLADSHPGRIISQPGDVSNMATVQNLVQAATAHFGSLDVVVANAGITLFQPFLETTPDAFDKVMGVNLKGSYFLAQAATETMKANQWGRIIFMSSCVGKLALEGLSVYSMTKAALRMLAKSLSLELGQFGITVNALAPGATLTERTRQELPNYAGSWGALLPSGRVGTPEDIAAAALFLASDAARQITGTTLEIDGGWTSLGAEPEV